MSKDQGRSFAVATQGLRTAVFLTPLIGILISSCAKVSYQYNCLTAPNSIVSWWDGSSVSGLSAADRVRGSSANDGTLSSNVSIVSGTIANAFNFNGSSTSVTIPTSSSLNPTGGLSISTWVKSNLKSKHSTPVQTILSNWGLQNSTGFSQASSWSGVNIGIGGILGSNYVGFGGTVFDGRYTYFVPKEATSGYVARYDTQMSFSSASSWVGVHIASAGILGSKYKTFYGGIFDGRYVYFVPHNTAVDGGYFARYDTQGEFNPTSGAGGWTGVNVESAGILGTGYVGFTGSAYDGRYIYFGQGTFNPAYGGHVARYDTQKVFSPSSGAGGWTGVNIAAAGILGANYKGTYGAVFDGRYVYFPPDYNNASDWHGYLPRYDTQGEFSPASGAGGWTGVNIGLGGVLGSNYVGFDGATFDGRYIYLIPFYNTAWVPHGNVARYDTRGVFAPSSGTGGWTGVNIADSAYLGSNYRGFNGATFDGRYIYFVPNSFDSNSHGNVARLDTLGSFTSSTSWTGVNIGAGGILGSNYREFVGSTFDGRYIYFSPWKFAAAQDGYVARYDTTSSAASYVLNYSGSSGDGISPVDTGPSLTINTTTGPISLHSHASLTAGTWYHIVATYDGVSAMKFYINGELIATQAASGLINASTSNITLGALTGGGGYFDGLIDDVQVYSTDLSAAQVSSLYQSSTLWCH